MNLVTLPTWNTACLRGDLVGAQPSSAESAVSGGSFLPRCPQEPEVPMGLEQNDLVLEQPGAQCLCLGLGEVGEEGGPARRTSETRVFSEALV